MSFSSGYIEPPLTMVSPWSPWSPLFGLWGQNNAASGTYESANRAVYYPVWIPTVCVAKRMWWVNGATVDAGYNVDVGIYRDGGYKPGAKAIVTGSTAQGTANQVQFVDITDTTLTPGLWWLFITCSTTSATFFRNTIASSNFMELFRFQEASIAPGSSPATATPAEGSSQNVYVFGFSTTTIT